MSDLSTWIPHSQRTGKLPEGTLIDGVPQHLWQPLIEWMGSQGSAEFVELGLKLHVTWEPDDIFTSVQDQANALVTAIREGPNPEETMLDAIEGMLVLLTERVRAQRTTGDRKAMTTYRLDKASRLDKILELGGSRWISNDKGQLLVERVEQAVSEVVEAALVASQRSSASDHLRAAWASAYGRRPNPSDSYGESIKAVEAAAAPVVSPNNQKATLGTILGDLKANPARWVFAIDPGTIDPVVVSAQMLWDGQTDRHGGVNPTRPIEPEAARAAVVAAAGLVHWFASGLITRK